MDWFAVKCGSLDGLVCADVNPRACCLATANAALNCVSSLAIETNVFEHLESTAGGYRWMLCNPPFVAAPSQIMGQSNMRNNSLYAGGGEDGTEVVERFLSDAFGFLEDNGKIVMVTELPNVEDSCQFLRSFMAGELRRVGISVVYVGADVEKVADYALKREEEQSFQQDTHSQWIERQRNRGIRNRALVVVALHEGMDFDSVHCYEDEAVALRNEMVQDAGDEEDALLTTSGIRYLRSSLLIEEGWEETT